MLAVPRWPPLECLLPDFSLVFIMPQVLLIILVYIVGPIAILVWAVKRYQHGVKPTFGELSVVGVAIALMGLFATSSLWNSSDGDAEDVARIVVELTQRYDFPVKAKFQDRPAVEGIARARRLEIRVYGVIDSAGQAKVVAALKKLRQQIASKPIVVYFFRAEVWEETPDGSRRPRRDQEELLRQVRVE
jgi:hypothetical protein